MKKQCWFRQAAQAIHLLCRSPELAGLGVTFHKAWSKSKSKRGQKEPQSSFQVSELGDRPSFRFAERVCSGIGVSKQLPPASTKQWHGVCHPAKMPPTKPQAFSDSTLFSCAQSISSDSAAHVNVGGWQ